MPIDNERLIEVAKRKGFLEFSSSSVVYDNFVDLFNGGGIRTVFFNGSSDYEVKIWRPADSKDGRLAEDYLDVLKEIGGGGNFKGSIGVRPVDTTVASGDRRVPFSFIVKEGGFSFRLDLKYVHAEDRTNGYDASVSTFPSSNLMKKVLEDSRFAADNIS